MPNGSGAFIDFRSKDELDEIRRNRIKVTSDKASVSFNGALELIPGPRNTALRILRNAIEEDEENLIEADKELGQRSDGRPLTMKRFKKKAIVAIGKQITKYRKNPTIVKAARLLGVAVETIRRLIKEKELDVVPAPFDHVNLRGIRVKDAQIKELMKTRTAPDVSVSVDEAGSWLGCGLAMKTYPHASTKILYQYANKPCPQLGGDVLHAKSFPSTNTIAPPRGARRDLPCLKWLEADLKRLVKAEVGKPGQVMAQAARERAERDRQSQETAPVPDLHARIVDAIDENGRRIGALVETNIIVTKGVGAKVDDVGSKVDGARDDVKAVGASVEEGRAESKAAKVEVLERFDKQVVAEPAVAPAPAIPSDCIIYHGGTSYSIGGFDPVSLTDPEHEVLSPFLRIPSMKKKALIKAAGNDNAPRTLGNLATKYDGRFKPAITLPGLGGKAKGGYAVKIRQKTQNPA